MKKLLLLSVLMGIPLFTFADVDVNVTLQPSATIVQPGNTVTMTASVTNGYDATEGLEGFILRIDTAEGLEYLGDNAGGLFSEATNEWTVPPIGPGSQQRLQIYYQVRNDATGTIRPMAEVADDGGDGNISTQDLSDPISAGDITITTEAITPTITTPTTTTALETEVADIGVAIATPRSLYTVDDEFVITVTVKDNSLIDVTNLQLEVPIPRGLAFTGISEATNGSYNYATGIWEMDELLGADEAVLTIGVSVLDYAASTIKIDAEIIRMTETESTSATEAPDKATTSISITGQTNEQGLIDAAETGNISIKFNVEDTNVSEIIEGKEVMMIVRATNTTDERNTLSGTVSLHPAYEFGVDEYPCFNSNDRTLKITTNAGKSNACRFNVFLKPGAVVNYGSVPLPVIFQNGNEQYQSSLTPVGAKTQWKVSCFPQDPTVGETVNCTYSTEVTNDTELNALKLQVDWSSGYNYLRHSGENFDPVTQIWSFPGAQEQGVSKVLNITFNAAEAGILRTELNALQSIESIQLTANSIFFDEVTARGAIRTEPTPTPNPEPTVQAPASPTPIITEPTITPPSTSNNCTSQPIEWVKPTTPEPYDIDGYIFKESLMQLWQRGIMTGQGDDGDMTPDRKVNRAEVSALIARSAKMTLQVDCNTSTFTDVLSNQWYHDWVGTLYNKGIISGYRDSNNIPNGFFGPADNVKLGEMSKMVINTFELAPGTGNATQGHWAADYILQMRVRNLLPGDLLIEENYDRTLTRGEVGEILWRVIKG